MNVERLTEADLADALALSTQAGWNQTAADWRRLLDVEPGGCFAGRVDGDLVATATLASHGDLGWVGMVLVEESHRRQGYGTEMVRTALEAADDAGLSVVGLDATDAGREVYRRMGFADVAPIERWRGTLEPGPEAGRADRAAPPELEAIVRLDRRVTGTSRAPLLRHMLFSPDVSGFVVPAVDDTPAHIHTPGGREVEAYAIVRPGRTLWHVGPVVGDEANVAALLSLIAAEYEGRDVCLDVFPGTAPTDLLGERGLESSRALTRMLRGGEEPALLGERVVAGAGFEWG